MDYDQLPTDTTPNHKSLPQDTDDTGIFDRIKNYVTNKDLFKYTPWFVLVVFIIIFSCVFISMLPPSNFSTATVTVESGASVRSIGTLLAEKQIIKSPALFELCSRVVGKKGTISAGNYLFETPAHVCRVAYRMSRGIYGNTQARITIPEGSTYRDIANIVAAKYTGFNKSEFLSLAKPFEGTLFPDTYFFFSGITSQGIIDELVETHHKKTAKLLDTISDPQKKREIIIMASILEREANNAEEAKVISGILWKRITIGMPLQADATLKYTTGRGSSELTLDDLRTDGPYNTYTRTGLPPGPIGNPGLAMIESAMNPKKSPYLYYLHDSGGKIYYAKTHDEHVRNKNKYLK
jgi:UPF0755 protein